MTEVDVNRLRHDIRTPLAVVTGFAELLASDRTITDEQRRDYAIRIAQAALELRKLLDGADRLDRS